MRRFEPRAAAAAAIFFLAGCAAVGPFVLPERFVPTIPGAEYVGKDTCATCHRLQARDWAQTVHARAARHELPAADRACEGCHGPGSLHVQGRGDTAAILRAGVELPEEFRGRGDPAFIFRFRDLPRDRRVASSGVCLSCHTGWPVGDVAGSVHDMAGVACVDCHNPMKPTEKLLREPDPDLCLSCHEAIRPRLHLPSHHPIREGKLRCSSCHDPHGTENRAMLRRESPRDLCLSCHPQHEGPFLFEHPPVTEDCGICHEPHGTVAENLKRREEPFLCMQCHPGHQSQLLPLQNIMKVPEKRAAFYTKCTQCHPTIHGTDLPSTTGRGRFTR